MWRVDLPDIASRHLHPRDVGGALVSIDQPVPAGAWRWGGPWTAMARPAPSPASPGSTSPPSIPPPCGLAGPTCRSTTRCGWRRPAPSGEGIDAMGTWWRPTGPAPAGRPPSAAVRSPRLSHRHHVVRAAVHVRPADVDARPPHRRPGQLEHRDRLPRQRGGGDGGRRATPHDARYDMAAEYLEVLYRLWEGSWEDGAVVRARATGCSPTRPRCTPSRTPASTTTSTASTCPNRHRNGRPCCSRPVVAAWAALRRRPRRVRVRRRQRACRDRSPVAQLREDVAAAGRDRPTSSCAR